MNYFELKQAYGFYENELVNHFLKFWIPRCVDCEDGGFVNCFDNRGETLVSTDKYVWSQGRFVWIFSKLAILKAPIFSKEQRDEFLALAKHGADFLKKYCLIGENDWRCVFLLNKDGTPKMPEGINRLDSSIAVDCLVTMGMANYAVASGDRSVYEFAKNLYESMTDRVKRGDYATLPTPLSPEYRAHGVPMNAVNTSNEMFLAAQVFDPEYCSVIQERMKEFSYDILDHFADEQDLIHEVITKDNQFLPKLLGMHINPGHTVEDAWFLLESQKLADDHSRDDQIHRIVLKALETGWDDTYGGLVRYASVQGGKPEGDNTGLEEEPTSKQLAGWGDKLWWVHSEALYTTLRCYFETEEETFYIWYQKLFSYIYRTFPNEDPEIREWIQIHRRDGQPEDKVVGLPVKDPYHVIRNLCLLIEMLYERLKLGSKK